MKNLNQTVLQNVAGELYNSGVKSIGYRPTPVLSKHLRGAYGDALQHFNKLYRERKLYLSSIDLLGKYGEYFWNKGEAESALNALNEAVQLAPHHAPSHNRIASFYWLTGDCARALHHYRIARDLDPNDRDTVWNCGQIMIELGEIHSAKYLYTNYLRDNGPDSEVEVALDLLESPNFTGSVSGSSLFSS